QEELHFANGLSDFMKAQVQDEDSVVNDIFSGDVKFSEQVGSVEWAVAWVLGDSHISTYCNTIPTPLGGTHEQGMRNALTKGLKNFAILAGNKKAGNITPDDVMCGCLSVVSLFIREPEFQGQTKEKLSSSQATPLVE